VPFGRAKFGGRLTRGEASEGGNTTVVLRVVVVPDEIVVSVFDGISELNCDGVVPSGYTNVTMNLSTLLGRSCLSTGI
jgi:hypothetical protein